jgi:hypothetical protein
MRRTLAIAVLIGGLALAACDPAPDTGVPTADGIAGGPGASAGGLTAYVTCVREHGVNVSDPAPGVDIAAWIRQQAEADIAFDAADIACQHLLPAGALPPPDSTPGAQELEQLRAFAVCMRAHDIEISDPTPDGNMQIGGRLENATRAQVETDPAYQAAQEACKDKLPAESEKK